MDRMMSYRYLYKQQILQHISYGERTDEMTSPREFSIPTYGPSLPPDVKVELVNRELWQQFHGETTEMIITKLGRRMFPSLQLNISGLQNYLHYYVVVELFPASPRRHKYCGNPGTDDVNGKKGGNLGGWTTAGPAEQQAHLDRRIYLHPDGPAIGAHWMQHIVSFSKLKVTNNTADPANNVVLTSMHRYIPRIWIFQCKKVNSLNEFYSRSIPSSLFTFEETEFIAVTAYQNESITRLKIDNNPFAKGFRETGQSRCKRKFQSVTSYHHSQTNDEEHDVSLPEPDVNRNARDDRRTSRTTRSEISGSDDGVGVTASQSSMSTSDQQDEMPSRLHRPWLNPSPVFAKRSNSPLLASPSSSSSSSSSSVSPSSSSITRQSVLTSSYNRHLHRPVVMRCEYPLHPCYFTACVMYCHDKRIWPLYLCKFLLPPDKRLRFIAL